MSMSSHLGWDLHWRKDVPSSGHLRGDGVRGVVSWGVARPGQGEQGLAHLQRTLYSYLL